MDQSERQPTASMIAPMTRQSVFLSALLFLAVLCSAVSSSSAQASLVAPELMQRAMSDGSVRVIVELGGITAVPEGFLRDDLAVATQRGDIATAQDAVSHALRGTTHSLVRRFETVPLLACYPIAALRTCGFITLGTAMGLRS